MTFRIVAGILPGMADLGLTIRALREALQLTQDQLAKILGVKRGSVSNWENGINHPRGKRLKRLADALNVSEAQLISGNTAPSQGRSGSVISIQYDGSELPIVAVKSVEPALWSKTKQGMIVVQEKSGRRFGILATPETIEALTDCLAALRELL